MERFDDTTTLITGGSSGVGYATAELLTRSGGRVAITGRDQTALDLAASNLGDNATAIRSDAVSLNDITVLAEHVRETFGALDLLFVNAGVTHFAPVEDMTEHAYDEVFDINVKGAYFTLQKLAPLVRSGGGVVLTTSVANIKGLPLISAYAATKAALRSMTRSFAREYLPRGIRVNAVSPGPIDTGILERAMSEEAAAEARSQMTADNPMHRFGSPAEVAKAVVFLGFDATYTTGFELTVDGGATQI